MNTAPSRQEITAAVLFIRDRYRASGLTPYDIGNGVCYDFAEDVLERVIGSSWIHEEGRHNWCSLSSEELYQPIRGRETTEDASSWDWHLLDHHYGIRPSARERATLDAIVSRSPSHGWVFSDGFHFDAECPEGVSSFFELPFFRRYLTVVTQTG